MKAKDMTEELWLQEVNRLKNIFLTNEKIQEEKLVVLDAARSDYFEAERALSKSREEYRNYLQKHP